MNKFYYALICLVLTVGLHFAANALGIYDAQIAAGSVWIDNIFHILAGMAFGFLGLWLVEKYKPGTSKTQRILWALLTVLMAAIVWELIEYGFMTMFETYARSLKIYSPSVAEAMGDVCSNLVGGLIAVAISSKEL